MRAFLVAFALILTACTSTTDSGVSPWTSASTSTTPRVYEHFATTTPIGERPRVTSTPIAGEPAALVTPGGVPVTVTQTLAPGFWVVTPCGREQFMTAGTPLYGATVVLDPGHGGPNDTGAVGRNGLAEKVVNLRVARLAAGFLEENGVEVALTRTGDYASPLHVRAGLADSLEAELMVSIHHNAPTPAPSENPGVEVFIQEGSTASARLGGLLWETSREALSLFDVAWSAAEDEGVMTVLDSRGSDAYGILRHPDTATALVELGYMSNPPEAELFATALYPRVAARAVAEAVTAYLDSETTTGSGYVEGRQFDPGPGIAEAACENPDLG